MIGTGKMTRQPSPLRDSSRSISSKASASDTELGISPSRRTMRETSTNFQQQRAWIGDHFRHWAILRS
jgi:hypothetical protein